MTTPRLILATSAAVITILAIGATVWLMSRGVAYREVGVRCVEEVAAAGTAAPHVRAARELAALAPKGLRIEIDTFGGRLRVFDGETLLREAVSSAGSGVALRDPRDGKFWIFETPLGERRVERKAVDPVWTKPDWAFVEEGLLPPLMGHPERYDHISLGDYAFYLGDGYLIHGTLFQTTLGSRVTHGCIRLGDEDLEWLYHKVPNGTRVWLY